MRTVAMTGSDFGLSEAVNEAIERAHRDGVLTHASLMIAGPAAQDAVRRAKRMPGLKVGLHLVVADGPALLPDLDIPDLVDVRGWFRASRSELSLNYAFVPAVRRQLAAEIRAQFAAFAATGLVLHHADGHRHMHLHPAAGRMLLEIGGHYDLRRVRVPFEPRRVLRACGARPTLRDRALRFWAARFRRAAAAAGVATGGPVFGAHWTGQMTEERVLALLARLPDGESDLNFHPALRADDLLRAELPGYAHMAELAALLSPRVRAALAATAPATE